MDAARPEAALGDFEAATKARDDVGQRHAYVVEMHLAVSMRRVVIAKHRQHAFDLDAGGVHRHQHHSVLAVAAEFVVGC